MPYEGNDATTADFIDKLCYVEELINTNLDCHMIVDGDFKIDFGYFGYSNTIHTL